MSSLPIIFGWNMHLCEFPLGSGDNARVFSGGYDSEEFRTNIYQKSGPSRIIPLCR